MLQRVGQPLLNDPVGVQFHRRPERPDLARGPHLDVIAVGAGRGDQPVDVGEGRLRGHHRGAVIVAEQPDQSAHLADRVQPAPPDRSHGLPRLARFAVQRLIRGTGLQDHDAQRVADDVVQFVGDPAPLASDGRRHLELTIAFDLRGSPPGVRLPAPGPPHGQAHRQRQAERDQRPQHVRGGLPRRLAQAHHGGECDDDRAGEWDVAAVRGRAVGRHERDQHAPPGLVAAQRQLADRQHTQRSGQRDLRADPPGEEERRRNRRDNRRPGGGRRPVRAEHDIPDREQSHAGRHGQIGQPRP